MPHPSVVATILILAASPALAQGGRDGALARLEDAKEDAVIEGARQCASANDVPGVELLLGVMDRERQLTRVHLTAAHYRDVTFEFLTHITDGDARRRVAQELSSNKQNPWARQWAAEALGFYDQATGPQLVKALGDKFLGTQRWAAWSLGQIAFQPAVEKLQRAASDKDDILRANATISLARIDRKFADLVATGIRTDKSAGVRAALLGAAIDVCGEDAEQLASATLTDTDWRPRAQAVDNLGKTRTKTAVDALIRALQDGRAAVSNRALRALQELTGQPITQKEVWPQWWADHRETFAFPESSKVGGRSEEPHTVAFEGIPLTSDNVAFAIDKSVWMGKLLATSDKRETRDAAAYDELKEVVARLAGSDVAFNVFVYADEIDQLGKKSVKLTDKSAKRALDFATREASGKGKDQWRMLEHLMEYPEIDTVYFISSGEADIGLYVHGNRIGRHLQDLNRFYKKTIHAIAYSEQGFHHHVKAISDATGGTFRGIE